MKSAIDFTGRACASLRARHLSFAFKETEVSSAVPEKEHVLSCCAFTCVSYKPCLVYNGNND